MGFDHLVFGGLLYPGNLFDRKSGTSCFGPFSRSSSLVLALQVSTQGPDKPRACNEDARRPQRNVGRNKGEDSPGRGQQKDGSRARGAGPRRAREKKD